MILLASLKTMLANSLAFPMLRFLVGIEGFSGSFFGNCRGGVTANSFLYSLVSYKAVIRNDAVRDIHRQATHFNITSGGWFEFCGGNTFKASCKEMISRKNFPSLHSCALSWPLTFMCIHTSLCHPVELWLKQKSHTMKKYNP